jgi:hypothetical protein
LLAAVRSRHFQCHEQSFPDGRASARAEERLGI